MLGSVVQVHLSPPLIPVPPISLRSSVFAAVLALAAIGDVSAQLRSIPDDAKRAQLRYVREMIVEIDGDRVRLSPGSQIRSVDNRIVLPSSLPQESLLVKYMTDAGGLVHRVWILSQDEAARPDKKK